MQALPKYKGAKLPESYVYVIARRDSPVCKVGMTKNVKSRMSSLQTGSAEELFLVFQSDALPRISSDIVERTAHYLLSSQKITGEWFNASHEVARLAVESAIDLVIRGHNEHDFPALVEQTQHQLRESGLI